MQYNDKTQQIVITSITSIMTKQDKYSLLSFFTFHFSSLDFNLYFLLAKVLPKYKYKFFIVCKVKNFISFWKILKWILIHRLISLLPNQCLHLNNLNNLNNLNQLISLLPLLNQLISLLPLNNRLHLISLLPLLNQLISLLPTNDRLHLISLLHTNHPIQLNMMIMIHRIQLLQVL